MDKKELLIIQELMDKLAEQMEPNEEDFGERLGRKKPEVKAIEVNLGKCEPMEGLEEEEYEGMEEESEGMEEEEEVSPEASLKSRLMKLRSKG